MNSEENQLLSDDDELPDLFADSEVKFEIAQHDIVWADYRNRYWPAIVRSVKKKEKIAIVWYLDTPNRCFRRPFAKIKMFADPDTNVLVKSQFENSPLQEKHNRLYWSAVTFMRRQAQGYKDDPASYFDLNKHYLAHKNIKPESKISSKIENNEVTSKIGNSEPTLKTEDNDSSSSDAESVVSDIEEESLVDKELSLFTNLDESLDDDPETNNIVKCIAAGYVDKHLHHVKSKKVPSQYQDSYDKGLKTGKLLYLPPIEHVKNIAKLKEISTYLMNYYEARVEGGKGEMVKYVLNVWMPEAITKAVELIKEGSLNLSKAIPESRKKQLPTDKLLIGQMYDPLITLRNASVNEAKGKKRGRPKGSKTIQAKIVEVSDSNEDGGSPAKFSCEEECELPVKSPSHRKDKLPAKSPIKRRIKKPVKFTSEGEKPEVKSPNEKEDKVPVTSQSEEEKPQGKSPNNVSARSSIKRKIIEPVRFISKEEKPQVKSPNKKENKRGRPKGKNK